MQPLGLNNLIFFFCLGFSVNGYTQGRSIQKTEYQKPTPVEQMSTANIYSATKVVHFDEWAAQAPVEYEFLRLHGAFAEPTTTQEGSDGVLRKSKERLTVFINRSQFTLAKPAAAVNLAKFASITYLNSIDPTISHTQIDSSKLLKDKSGQAHNSPPDFKWCDGRATQVCVESIYQYPAVIKAGIGAVNLALGMKKDAFSRAQSELRFVTPQELASAPALAKLTGVATPFAGALDQSVFYFNQLLQFGKSVGLLQPHPTNPAQSVVTSYFVLGIERKWYEIEASDPTKARMLTTLGLHPRDILLGKSTVSTKDQDLLSGLPNYTQQKSKAIADLLDR